MHGTSPLAEVTRSAIVWGVVAFLGYLAYTVVKNRLAHPSPQAVTFDSDDWQNLTTSLNEIGGQLDRLRVRLADFDRRENDATKARTRTERDLDSVKRSASAIRERVDRLAAKDTSNRGSILGLPPGTALEYGKVVFQRPQDYDGDCRVIKFKNRYKSPPMILTTQWNRTRRENEVHWLTAVPEDVTKTGAKICVHVLPKNRHLKYEFTYVVIGQVAQ